MTPRGSQLNLLTGRARALAFRLALACCALTLLPAAALADRLHLKSGAVIEVDEVWENADGVWYRRGAVTQLIAKDRVLRVEKSPVETGSGEKVPVEKDEECHALIGRRRPLELREGVTAARSPRRADRAIV